MPSLSTLQPNAPWPPNRDRIAGVDEAGRGPWAGPVVAAAVILRRRRLPARIDDSKRLTKGLRERAFAVILEHAEISFGIACADEIDSHNILQATFLAMRRAVEGLPTPPALVLVDGHLAPPIEPPCRPIVGGDATCYVISCASIMAKVFRDSLMEFYHRLHPRYGFNRHKGYGTSLHAERLRRFGPSVFHRQTFRPVRESIVMEAGRVE